jgi:hypothetical protein
MRAQYLSGQTFFCPGHHWDKSVLSPSNGTKQFCPRNRFLSPGQSFKSEAVRLSREGVEFGRRPFVIVVVSSTSPAPSFAHVVLSLCRQDDTSTYARRPPPKKGNERINTWHGHPPPEKGEERIMARRPPPEKGN